MADTFLSFAYEDRLTADKLVTEIQRRGFSVWYAPSNLEVGDRILQSIETGIRHARSGTLLLSKTFLKKNWPKAELDSLLRRAIEDKIDIFPIWLGVSKEDVQELSSMLSGIQGIEIDNNFSSVADQVGKKLSRNAPTVCVVPIYSNPKYKFLSGDGEMLLKDEDGPATSLWELLLHLKENEYPVYIMGETFSREDLLFHAAQSMSHIPDVVEGYVQKTGYNKIWQMCKDAGIDPALFE